MVLNKPVVGMAATPDGGGYWLVASDGGIFSYGDASSTAAPAACVLNKPIVGMAVGARRRRATGWWPPTAGSSATATAAFYGSTGSMRLNKPVVGMAATPSGNGYWLVASDGGIFSYGDASFHGSTGSLVLNKPIVGMITGPGRRRLLPRRLGRRHLQLRHGALLRLARGADAQAPDRGGGGHADRQRLLVHRHRRTGLEFRRRPTTTGRRPRPSSGRSSAWRRLPAARRVRGRHVPVGRLRLRHQHVPVHELADR